MIDDIPPPDPVQDNGQGVQRKITPVQVILNITETDYRQDAGARVGFFAGGNEIDVLVPGKRKDKGAEPFMAQDLPFLERGEFFYEPRRAFFSDDIPIKGLSPQQQIAYRSPDKIGADAERIADVPYSIKRWAQFLRRQG